MKNVSQCKLCQKIDALCVSHVIPKFIWRDSGIIGDKKNYAVTCLSNPELSERNRQDGYKEPLLCLECESRFQVWEAYMRPRLAGAIVEAEKRPKSAFIWQGWDYEKTKLFQMSILWRMGVSSLPLYGMVQLGKHEQILRSRLLANDAGEPWRYACASVLLVHAGKPVPGVFGQPERIFLGSQPCYRILIAGMLWFIMASSHAPTKLPMASFLNRSGEWPMFYDEMVTFPFLKEQIEIIRSQPL